MAGDPSFKALHEPYTAGKREVYRVPTTLLEPNSFGHTSAVRGAGPNTVDDVQQPVVIDILDFAQVEPFQRALDRDHEDTVVRGDGLVQRKETNGGVPLNAAS
jgi:hypothetical protein